MSVSNKQKVYMLKQYLIEFQDTYQILNKSLYLEQLNKIHRYLENLFYLGKINRM